MRYQFWGEGVYLEGFIHGGAYLRNFTLPVGVILDPGGGGGYLTPMFPKSILNVLILV